MRVPKTRLLAEDLELASRLGEPTAQALHHQLLVPVELLEPGAWSPPAQRWPMGGYILLEGALARNVSLAGTTSTQVFGPGAFVQPDDSHSDSSLPWHVAWYALDSSRLAVIDRQVAVAAGRHPVFAAALIERARSTAEEAGFMHAVSNLSRLDARLLALLWQLADRFGRVSREGTILRFPLSHRLLAQMVGAKRASVTTALRQLAEGAALSRREDGAWVLHGDPAAQLERILATPPQRQPGRARTPFPRVTEQIRVPQPAVVHRSRRNGGIAGAAALEAKLRGQLERLHADHLRAAQRVSRTVEQSQAVRDSTAELLSRIRGRRDDDAAA